MMQVDMSFPDYNGSESMDLTDWIQNFEDAWRVSKEEMNKDEDQKKERKAAWLQSKLKGPARDKFESLDDNVKKDYGLAIAALKKHFITNDTVNNAIWILGSIQQEPDESIDGFRHRLTKAVARVMPDDTQAERDKRIMQEFVTKHRKEIKAGMALMKIETLEEAIDAAKRAERQQKILQNREGISSTNYPSTNTKGNMVTMDKDDLAKMLQDLMIKQQQQIQPKQLAFRDPPLDGITLYRDNNEQIHVNQLPRQRHGSPFPQLSKGILVSSNQIQYGTAKHVSEDEAESKQVRSYEHNRYKNRAKTPEGMTHIKRDDVNVYIPKNELGQYLDRYCDDRRNGRHYGPSNSKQWRDKSISPPRDQRSRTPEWFKRNMPSFMQQRNWSLNEEEHQSSSNDGSRSGRYKPNTNFRSNRQSNQSSMQGHGSTRAVPPSNEPTDERNENTGEW